MSSVFLVDEMQYYNRKSTNIENITKCSKVLKDNMNIFMVEKTGLFTLKLLKELNKIVSEI